MFAPFCLLIFVLQIAAQARPLEIKETRWGFDGRVVPERFNILSVLVANPTPVPFEGELALEETRGMEQSVGAPYVQPIYLAPHSARYVQFQPFVAHEGSWLLRWGRGAKESEKLDEPRFAGPARVVLTEPESAFASRTGVRTFPDDLFPTTAAATDALDAVVLDHAPRWEASRREAFLDWLRRGGTVHLLHGANGQHPEFSGDLAVLNGTGPQTRVGSGTVRRHAIARGDLAEKFLDEHGSPARELKRGQSVMLYNLDSTLLQQLAALTRPEIAWWLIYLLTASYIFVVGPGHYFWGRQWNWRLSIAAFAGVVALYAVAFAWAGKRGANETQRVHSLAIARALGGGRCDVTQWISPFMTRGDLYRLTHDAPSNLYAVAADFEAVRARIQSGRDGSFAADIPLYSSRPFLHRAVMRGPDTSVTVEKWTQDEKLVLRELVLVPGAASFPEGITEMFARHGGSFYPMKQNGNRWERQSQILASDFFAAQHLTGMQTFRGSRQREVADESWLEKPVRVLVGRAIGGVEGLQFQVPPKPFAPDHLQLFIYAHAPESFRVKGGDFESHTGRVLYVQDVFRPALP